MHDQKKKEKQHLTREAEAAAAEEHERVGALYKSVLTSNKAHDYSAEILTQTEALLMAIPEAYTAYNCRRLALKAVASLSPRAEASVPSTEVSSPTATPISTTPRPGWLVEELKLNSKVLLLNYKNYNAFLHRHWIFNQLEALAKLEMQQSAGPAAGMAVETTAPGTYELLCDLLRKERAQCEQLLQLDERNFHAWNYRRWVLAQEHRATQIAVAHRLTPSPSASAEEETQSIASAAPPPVVFSPEETAELAYTVDKIKNNFSNYSAWHQRSLAIQSAVSRWQLYQEQNGLVGATGAAQQHKQAWRAALLAQLREDIDFLKQAVYCDPNDQSAWFYAPFVFQLLRRQYSAEDGAEDAAALEDSFMYSVIELVAELDRVGAYHECYLPYYFLLDQLVVLQAASGSTDTRSSRSLERHIATLSEKVSSFFVTADGGAVGGGEGASVRLQCFQYLHMRLREADKLRRCLYDDLFQRALKGCE
ncbi:hypothetical protein JKF63_02115 [Porcisia hertigi]|uniref:Geranylgeranyl transferase type-2 subunit alpha n=1 Tax=Porcisia hertigi TaxID=2761500 RepID=A0A836HYW9_9TRYP|nr:hypothetical protein JKF63_02115 [Porcisia hertigi]